MDTKELLRFASVRVAAETYNLVGLSHDDWAKLLSNPARSPRMSVPFMIFKDDFEVTLVVDDQDLAAMTPGLLNAKVERGYRLLTFDIVLELSVVGFMAEISRILADAGVSILPISSFSRDHILIRQSDLPAGLKALGPHVGELC